MNVLVACEFSGVVRDAFLRLGCNAVSVDLLDSEAPGPHIVGDVLGFLEKFPKWDLLIAFPPCTYLTVSGNRWMNDDRRVKQRVGIEFVRSLWNVKVPRVCIENPVGVLSTQFRAPSMYFQPWYFGHGEVKRTCLWLRGLPCLVPSKVVDGRKPVVHNHVRSWKDRSRTYLGVADAMAKQWSVL